MCTKRNSFIRRHSTVGIIVKRYYVGWPIETRLNVKAQFQLSHKMLGWRRFRGNETNSSHIGVWRSYTIQNKGCSKINCNHETVTHYHQKGDLIDGCVQCFWGIHSVFSVSWAVNPVAAFVQSNMFVCVAAKIRFSHTNCESNKIMFALYSLTFFPRLFNIYRLWNMNEWQLMGISFVAFCTRIALCSIVFARNLLKITQLIRFSFIGHDRSIALCIFSCTTEWMECVSFQPKKKKKLSGCVAIVATSQRFFFRSLQQQLEYVITSFYTHNFFFLFNFESSQFFAIFKSNFMRFLPSSSSLSFYYVWFYVQENKKLTFDKKKKQTKKNFKQFQISNGPSRNPCTSLLLHEMRWYDIYQFHLFFLINCDRTSPPLHYATRVEFEFYSLRNWIWFFFFVAFLTMEKSSNYVKRYLYLRTTHTRDTEVKKKKQKKQKTVWQK